MIISPRWHRMWAAVLLSLVLFVSACSPSEPSPYSQIQQETTERDAAPAVAKAAEQGSRFNAFFPRSVPGYDIVPYQEKKGFAEYKVNQDGQTVAMLAINDTTDTGAADKFQNSTTMIAGYPSVEVGQTATAVLVGDRFQVKVLSRSPAFTAEDRATWLEKFDLQGLANLS